MEPIGEYTLEAGSYKKLTFDSPEVIEMFRKEFPNPGDFSNLIENVLIEELNNRDATAQVLGTTYRTINHWEKVGLIDPVRSEQKGWRKYSYIELLWLFMLLELREIGVSIENLLKLKSILQIDKVDDNNPFPMLSQIALLRMRMPEPSEFWIIINGHTFTYNFAFNTEMLITKLKGNTSFIVVNLHKYEQDKLASTHSKISNLLQDPETSELMQLNDLIKTGKYSQVVIKFNNGKIERYEIEELFNPAKVNLHELRKEHEFSEISVVTKKGKAVYIKRNATIKP